MRNQLALAYEGDASFINEKLNTRKSIDEIFRDAQRAFNNWSELAPEQRKTATLLKMLSFDFFEVLDSVTIARSRKHIEKYYNMDEIGQFPERMKPVPLRPLNIGIGHSYSKGFSPGTFGKTDFTSRLSNIVEKQSTIPYPLRQELPV